jgi:RND family efflux transporter MFP subunit
VFVKEGDYVRKGQLIATMDARDYRVQLEATQAEYAQIKADAERVIELYKEQATTASNYDKARYGLSQITQKLQHHKNQLADTRLYAPISGYVQTRLHEAGETVGAGMPVVSIFANSNVEVEISVPSSDYNRLDQIMAAHCTFDVLPNDYPLGIVSISREANSSQLYPVKFRIRGPYDHSKITPGMTATVKLAFQEHGEQAVEVPSSAVFNKDGRTMVYVFDKPSSTVKAREVELHFIGTDGTTQISSGLQDGETVVTAGVRFLSDGQKVKEVAKTSESNVGGLL